MILLRNQEHSAPWGFDCILLGLVGQGVGAVVAACVTAWDDPVARLAADSMILLGTAVLVAGCGMLAVRRGRSRTWGLMGIFSFMGVAVVLSLRSPMPPTEIGGGFDVGFLGPYRRDVWRMDVRVEIATSVSGSEMEPIALQLPRGASIKSALKILSGPIPILAAEIPETAFTINGQPAKATEELSDGDKLTIFRAAAESISPGQT